MSLGKADKSNYGRDQPLAMLELYSMSPSGLPIWGDTRLIPADDGSFGRQPLDTRTVDPKVWNEEHRWRAEEPSRSRRPRLHGALTA